MAFDKVVDSTKLFAGMKATADAIREKTGSADLIVWDSDNGFKPAVEGIPAGNPEAEETLRSIIERSATPVTKLPDGLKEIGEYAFRGHSGLAVITLPEGVWALKQQCFAYCYNLTVLSFPSTLTRIDNYAFNNCTGLTEVTFNSTPTSMTANVFSQCTNLRTINVPWAEGEVRNAPWGATNATINYNYTGG